MIITPFSKYIFWSYKNDADLPDELIIRQVAVYGGIEDIIKLTKLYRSKFLINILEGIKDKHPKRINFITKVLL